MAEKTTKKTAAPKELSLTDQLVRKRTELADAKKSHAAGELVNPRVLTQTRKEIARLLTTINAQKGGK